jgi:hypothetical protein
MAHDLKHWRTLNLRSGFVNRKRGFSEKKNPIRKVRELLRLFHLLLVRVLNHSKLRVNLSSVLATRY